MTMGTRTAMRQRYPDLGKELKVVRDYDKYAKWEAELVEPGRSPSDSAKIPQRTQELAQESKRTLEALKEKQPVRIPELRDLKATGVGESSCAVGLGDKILENPLKPHKFQRTGNYIRHMTMSDPESDRRYDYEATDEDRKFNAQLKPPQFTVEEFERLINLFERENYKADNKIILFPSFVLKAEEDLMKRNEEGVKQIYDYWNKVRCKTLNNSLMRKYWRPADPNNNDPRVTFRSCKDEKPNLRRNRKYDEEYLKKVKLLVKSRWRIFALLCSTRRI
eukprot:TRINITY_DN14744_c0_g2_i2.p1 TRINITY_DN14744_c0_g2~~TRINITY_DN14744_c0_g2_i2.p1  ORF type:complete len:278 (+),score=86.00 TRINITY_DN14744_c0_g2_i2:154-987(+)